MKTTNRQITIVLTGGGSGGHITPLLSLAHALKQIKPACKVVYIGHRGEKLEKQLGSRYRIFDEVHHISAGKFRRYHGESFLAHLVDLKTLLLNIRDFFRVLAGLIGARRIIKEVKPNVVFSKGGFVAVPVGIVAHWQKIPIVTHDSDAAGGLANKIIGRYAQIHATGQPAEYYRYDKSSVRYIGIPVDQRLKPVSAATQAIYKKELGLPHDAIVLLVGGAGLGARGVNDKVITISQDLLNQLNDLFIIHLAGEGHVASVKEQYKKVLAGKSNRIKVIGFTPDLYKYSGAADLVVTRAGATTIAELAVQQKPAILIPAPQLTGGHQLKNAQLLESKRAVEVIDNNAPAEQLLGLCLRLLRDGPRRHELAAKLGTTAKPDAANQLARILIGLAQEQPI